MVHAPPNAFVIVPDTSSEASVVGGRKVDIRDNPWQVAIFDSTNNAFCGGCLLSATVVLTAQHCVEAYLERCQVGFGHSKLSEMVQAGLRSVKYIISYPRYQPYSEGVYGKDVALLVLDKPIEFSSTAKAIRLATPIDDVAGHTKPGTRAKISGWGTLSFRSQSYPDQLHAAQVRLVSRETALKRGMALYPDQIAAGQFPGAGRSKKTFGIELRHELN